MRYGRAARGVLLACLSLLLGGCGGAGEDSKPARVEVPAPRRPLAFVGFDASQPLVQALRQGNIQALVVQDPFKIGEMGVTTLVGALEKRDIPSRASTGEILITSENM